MAMGGGETPGAVGGASGALTNAWSPLGSGGGGGGGGGSSGSYGGFLAAKGPSIKGDGRAGLGMGGPSRKTGGMGDSGPGPGANRGMRPPSSPDPLAASSKGKARLSRTEFIIFFIWREPTPSDALMPDDGAAPGGETPRAG